MAWRHNMALNGKCAMAKKAHLGLSSISQLSAMAAQLAAMLAWRRSICRSAGVAG